MGGTRSARAWLTDLALVLVSTLLGLFFLAESVSDTPVPQWPVHAATGAVAAGVLVLWRRRRPVTTALVLIPMGILFALPMGAVPVALFAVALRRSVRVSVAVTGLHAVAVASVYRVAIGDTAEYWQAVPFLVALDVAVTAVAMLLRSRRQLVRSLADRAREVEQSQRLRVEEARHAERERIAREMHDVLAHRISLLAVHAGALQVRRDAPEQERQAASVIRQCAYEALEDLREAVWMLRRPTSDSEGERPQPTLADVPALVEQSRLAGVVVHFADGVTPGSVSQSAGRHAYRIVQEALTNARKHAPGGDVRVGVSAPARGGLTVEAVNPLARPPAGDVAGQPGAGQPGAGQPGAGLPGAGGPGAGLPGAGAGLIGLGERVQLAGGRLEYGPTPAGEFRLVAWLP